MEKVLQEISKTPCYLDDILITGYDDDEHLYILQKPLDSLCQWGLCCLKESKHLFMKNSVKHLGYVYTYEVLWAFTQ